MFSINLQTLLHNYLFNKNHAQYGIFTGKITRAPVDQEVLCGVRFNYVSGHLIVLRDCQDVRQNSYLFQSHRVKLQTSVLQICYVLLLPLETVTKIRIVPRKVFSLTSLPWSLVMCHSLLQLVSQWI